MGCAPTDESLVGVLPGGWRISCLGETCRRGGGDIQTGPFGSQLHASEYVLAGVPSIMPQSIGDNRISTQGISRISKADARRLSKYLVHCGDIVYSRRGDVGRRALVRQGEDGWLCGTGCLRIRAGSGFLDPVYLSYYLGHGSVRAWIVRHAVGATMPNLNTSILSSLPVVLPPLSEQRAIASILRSFDDKIELNSRMNETLETMVRAIFKSWFVDFDPVRAKMEGRMPVGMDDATAALFPDSFEESELGPIPRGWRIGSLSDAVVLNPAYRMHAGMVAPYVEMSRLPTNGARITGYAMREFASGTRFMNGDTLMARITPCLENGKTAFVDFLADGETGWGSTEFIVLRSKPPFPPEYSYMLARTAEFRTYAIQSMCGSSGRQRVSASALDAYHIVVPTSDVLNVFGELMSSCMVALRAHDDESSTLRSIRDTLLPKLISGELQVCAAEKVLEDAP